jgi:Ser/Thr protein kinase RdoA (MazF antagonist)
MEEDALREKLQYICRQFRISGEVMLYRWIPKGHINKAYYVAVYDGEEVKQYLVQKVNTYVFKNPVGMMRNIELITGHIEEKARTTERRRLLHSYRTAEGRNYVVLKDGAAIEPDGVSFDEEGVEFWRLYNYIESSVSFESAEGDTEVLRKSGKAFGRFLKQLQDFDAGRLTESIPHFHDTRHRLNTFFEAAEQDVCGRAAGCIRETEIIRQYRSFGETLCRALDRGELPLRVTHNDTKTNNILFDKATLDPLVVIDLDTCMPGLACYDFGDTIRFAACTAAEDGGGGMHLNPGLMRAYAEGYLGELTDVLTEAEIESLAVGAAVITLELAARFLSDWLIGDKYFRIEYPEQNLVRAKTQLSLFLDMTEHMEEMQAIIREVAETEKERVKIYII